MRSLRRSCLHERNQWVQVLTIDLAIVPHIALAARMAAWLSAWNHSRKSLLMAKVLLELAEVQGWAISPRVSTTRARELCLTACALELALEVMLPMEATVSRDGLLTYWTKPLTDDY